MPDMTQTHVACRVKGCKWREQVQPPADAKDAFRIRICPKHGVHQLTFSGAIEGMIGEDRDAFHAIPITDQTVEVALNTDLWRHFCRILDLSRPVRAGGNADNTACLACDEHNTHQIPGCGCPCHIAWRYREGMERTRRAHAHAA